MMSATDFFRVGRFACERVNQGKFRRTRQVMEPEDNGGRTCDGMTVGDHVQHALARKLQETGIVRTHGGQSRGTGTLYEQVCEVKREDDWHEGWVDVDTCKEEAERASKKLDRRIEREKEASLNNSHHNVTGEDPEPEPEPEEEEPPTRGGRGGGGGVSPQAANMQAPGAGSGSGSGQGKGS